MQSDRKFFVDHHPLRPQKAAQSDRETTAAAELIADVRTRYPVPVGPAVDIRRLADALEAALRPASPATDDEREALGELVAVWRAKSDGYSAIRYEDAIAELEAAFAAGYRRPASPVVTLTPRERSAIEGAVEYLRRKYEAREFNPNAGHDASVLMGLLTRTALTEENPRG